MQRVHRIVVLFSALLLSQACGRVASEVNRPKIGAVVYKFDDTFMSYVRKSLMEAAGDKVDLEMVDSANSQKEQDGQIDRFLARGVKALLVNPVDRTAANSIIKRAKAKGVPVVFFNREPLPEDMATWDRVYYVGADAGESGRMQGEILAKRWLAAPELDRNGDGLMQYVLLKGEPGHQDAVLRSEYTLSALRNAGIRLEGLVEDTAYWDRPKAFEKMRGYIAKFGTKIEAVICNNDDMALGAIDALRTYYPAGTFVPVVGVDGTPPAARALAQGTLLGTVKNDAESQGVAVFDIGFALAVGKDPLATRWKIVDGKYVWIPYSKMTGYEEGVTGNDVE